MIKLHYNGFDIEVSSIEEARQIMTGATAKKTQYIAKKKAKNMPWNKWTDDELSRITVMIKSNATKAEIARDKSLKDRHTKAAIKQAAHILQKGNPHSRSGIWSKYVAELRK